MWFLYLLSVFATVTAEIDYTKRCSIPSFYTEVECKPLYGNNSDCPTRFDCDLFYNRSSTKCYYKGVEYGDQQAVKPDPDLPCYSSCQCRHNKKLGYHAWDCKSNAKCAANAYRRYPGKQCYGQYKFGSCCPNVYCYPTGYKKTLPVTKCKYNGKTYLEGEVIDTDLHCAKCICQSGFNGTLEAPFCREITCGYDIQYVRSIKLGCARVYFGKRCCTSGHRCPAADDHVIRSGAESDLLYNRSSTKCYYKGIEYGDLQKIRRDPDLPCEDDCTCKHNKRLGYNAWDCPNISCPHQFDSDPHDNMNYYLQHKFEKCCPYQYYYPLGVKKETLPVARCEYNGKTYLEGEVIRTDLHCTKCICQSGFKGKLEAPFCREITCGYDLHHVRNIKLGCVFVHYRNSCCTTDYRCPAAKDFIIKSGSKSEENPHKRCTIPKVYSEIGCKPVYNDVDPCPTRFDCGLSSRSATQCYNKGVAYNIGDSLGDDPDVPCAVGCICTDDHKGGSEWTCAQVDCFDKEPSDDEVCYREQSFGSCCSKLHCYPKGQDIRNLPVAKCEYHGKTFLEGELIKIHQDCYSCICLPGFEGKLKAPFCKEISCGIDVYNSDKIRAGCVPVYYDSRCCPIDYRCPADSDSIVKSESGEHKDLDNVCTFGDLTLNIGDKLSPDNEKCVECTCSLPPLVTCIRKTNDECQ